MRSRSFVSASACLLALLLQPRVAYAADLATTAPADLAPQTVVLKSAERVTGTVVSRDDAGLVIRSAALGQVSVASDNIDHIIGGDAGAQEALPTDPPQQDPPAPLAADVKPAVQPAAQTEEAKPDRGLLGTGLFHGWNRTLEAGTTGTAGTTDAIAVNVRFNVSTDTERYRATFGAWYFLTKTSGAEPLNQTRVFSTFDKRLDGGPWFVFAKAHYENDAQQVWQNRISGFAGPGYEFVRNAKYELLGRVGLGYTYEFPVNTTDDYDASRPEALVGLDAKWVIDELQAIAASSYYTPSIEDFSGEGRLVSSLAYTVDLNKICGVGFRAGVEHTYEFKTPGPDEHNNFKYFINVLMKL